MARVSFFVPESGEKSFKLSPHRPVSIGRDPGNDIVLRDAKVSRHHARIVYERGFYVLHDLSSSNGSFVNGKRVKIAPLADGSELRVGSCKGVFTEEMEDAQARTSETKPEKAGGDPAPRQTAPGSVELATAPHPKGDVPRTEPGDDAVPGDDEKKSKKSATHLETGTSDVETGTRPRGMRYSIEARSPEREVSAVRGEDESTLFFFRNPVSLVGFVARLVSAMVTLTGAAVAVLLFVRDQPAPGATAILLTITFIFVILLLIPRQQIMLYSDDALSSIALMLIQETRFSFPSLRFTLRKPDGSVIGGFQKNLASNFGLRRWWILDRPGKERVGFAREESFGRALVRLVVATVRTNFSIYLHDRPVGFLNRRSASVDRHLLDLRSDPSQQLDRRVAIGLAVLIDAVEGR